MKFSAYLPPQARSGKVPVLYYLSGLTCTEETFPHQGACAADGGGIGIDADRARYKSARTALPGDADSWDFGYSAGFYVDATVAPWSQVLSDVQLCDARAAGGRRRQSAGAAERHRHLRPFHGRPRRADMRAQESRPLQIVSAFAPIAAPMQCPWGKKAFSNYLGADTAELARIRRHGAGGAQTISRSDPHRSRHRRSISGRAAASPRNFSAAAAKSGQVLNFAAGLRSRLLLHADLHGGSLAHHAKALTRITSIISARARFPQGT
jgi:S-formylglutathione hydrolase FrmB